MTFVVGCDGYGGLEIFFFLGCELGSKCFFFEKIEKRVRRRKKKN